MLIYSPTIMAGISFEESHYDQVFGYYQANVSSVENFMQMMGRVRIIKDGLFNVLMMKDPVGDLPTQIERIGKQVIQRALTCCEALPVGVHLVARDSQFVASNQFYFKTFLHNTRINNLSAKDPFMRFLNCIGAE